MLWKIDDIMDIIIFFISFFMYVLHNMKNYITFALAFG